MAKFTGRGAELQLQTVASPETWVAVAQVRRIGGFNFSGDEVEVTTLDVQGDFREFRATFRDPGELETELIFDPTLATHGSGANGVYGLFLTSEVRVWRVLIPVSPIHYFEFEGYFRDFVTGDLSTEDAFTATPVLRLTGFPALGTA